MSSHLKCIQNNYQVSVKMNVITKKLSSFGEPLRNYTKSENKKSSVERIFPNNYRSIYYVLIV